jgi:hypothetical protein
MSDTRYENYENLPKTNNLGSFFKDKKPNEQLKELKNIHLFLKSDDEIIGLRGLENTTIPAYVCEKHIESKESKE